MMLRSTLVGCLVALGCSGAGPQTPPPAAATPSEAIVARAESPAGPGAVATTTPDETIHGRLTTVDGQRVLYVWGTPHEMGFAHGALLRAQILEVLDEYALSVIPAQALNAVAPLYATVADISDELRAEAEGVVEGMKSVGAVNVAGLDRDLTASDLLVLNAMTDLLAIGCSSVSAWGAATANDATLGGHAAVVRNLDWSEHPALLRNQVLIAYAPSDPERQQVLSIAFAGYVGCLSCMNEAGVTALFNMGYGEGAASLGEAMTGFAPANLLLRDALERRDIDEDGKSTAGDIETELRAKRHAGSFIVHLLEPFEAGSALAPARVLEVEADGVVTRTPASTGPLKATLLAATNHLRGKDGPQACRRYATIERTATAAEGVFDREALWALGISLRLPEVVHTMMVEPQSRRLTLWFRDADESQTSTRAPVVHEWDTLFSR